MCAYQTGTRTVGGKDFFIGYRKTVLTPEEVVVSVTVPLTKETEYVELYKQARRREDDIAIVNSCMRVVLAPSDGAAAAPSYVIQDAAFAFGGMAAQTVAAKHLQQAVLNQPWNEALIPMVCKQLDLDLPLQPDVPGGMAE